MCAFYSSWRDVLRFVLTCEGLKCHATIIWCTLRCIYIRNRTQYTRRWTHFYIFDLTQRAFGSTQSFFSICLLQVLCKKSTWNKVCPTTKNNIFQSIIKLSFNFGPILLHYSKALDTVLGCQAAIVLSSYLITLHMQLFHMFLFNKIFVSFAYIKKFLV